MKVNKGVEVWRQLLLTSALDGGEWCNELNALTALHLESNPGVRWLGSWVRVERGEKSGFESLTVQPVAESSYRLSFLGVWAVTQAYIL
jgi:hypothetical protein